MTAGPTTAEQREEQALQRARLISGALAAGVLLLAGVSGFVELGSVSGALTAPAALIGIVGPLLGYRLYAWSRERLPDDADHPSRCDAFVRATAVALSVTEGIALLGIVAFWLSGKPEALIGLVTHVILTGAIWPTPERLEQFLRPAGRSEREIEP